MGTGFGMRPTSNTGHSDVDAFVWIKPGGECDGTSDTSAVRYDHFCGNPSAMKPVCLLSLPFALLPPWIPTPWLTDLLGS